MADIRLTSCHTVDLVLDEEVHQRHEGTEEAAGQVFPVLDGLGVCGAQGNAPGSPGNREDDVGDHQNVVPVVVVGRSDVRPPATRQGTDDAGNGDRFREGAAGFRGEQVP